MNFSNQIDYLLKSIYHTTAQNANAEQLHFAVSTAVMNVISNKWSSNQKKQSTSRTACYLSAEYLTGRLINNNLLNLNLLEKAKEYLEKNNKDISIFDEIDDPALGNGGLGRLAACFLDSAATHNLPLLGYGIRYKYGLFRQSFKDGKQAETADNWQANGDPWSVKREDLKYKVKLANQIIIATAFDYPVIPYQSNCVNTLRLFEATSINEFDFKLFNKQKYFESVKPESQAQFIHYCLYPNDDTKSGKLLRLSQEYFLCSAAVQDMLKTFKDNLGSNFNSFNEFYAVQLNDTHPVLAIPELIYQLGLRGVKFGDAYKIATQTFAFTNHTIMPEAMEKWEKKLIKSLLPHIYSIIVKIDKLLLAYLKINNLDDNSISKMRIIDKYFVNMAPLAIFCSHTINGVAKIHTNILKTHTLKEWYYLFPDKFQNKTNGITPRRWLKLANPELSDLITEKIGSSWVKNLSHIKKIEPFATNNEFQNRFFEIKQNNKKRLCDFLQKNQGATLHPNSIFDIQIKRLHEYKRQLLNALSALYFYFEIKDGNLNFTTPVTLIFGAKAAPGYVRAKAIIHLIHKIQNLIENDSKVSEQLKICFVENYNVSAAQLLVSAADISEQISTAGTEASGTGNMKFMLNGTVTLGTLDGANVEIVEKAGLENNYIFGAKVEEIEKIKQNYKPIEIYNSNPKLKRVLDSLVDSQLDPDSSGDFTDLYNALLNGSNWHEPDHYFVLLDFDDYIKTKLKCYSDYENKKDFLKKSIINMANAGDFSSDRTIKEYAKEIWRIKP